MIDHLFFNIVLFSRISNKTNRILADMIKRFRLKKVLKINNLYSCMENIHNGVLIFQFNFIKLSTKKKVKYDVSFTYLLNFKMQFFF